MREYELRYFIPTYQDNNNSLKVRIKNICERDIQRIREAITVESVKFAGSEFCG